jgi:LmbE family N-acetylglucosaminyl deacetylase
MSGPEREQAERVARALGIKIDWTRPREPVPDVALRRAAAALRRILRRRYPGAFVSVQDDERPRIDR